MHDTWYNVTLLSPDARLIDSLNDAGLRSFTCLDAARFSTLGREKTDSCYEKRPVSRPGIKKLLFLDWD